MKRFSFVTTALALGAGLSLLGGGCALFSGEPQRTFAVATIPSNFPTDVIQFPYATTTVAITSSSTTELVQLTSSSTAELVTWFNRAYLAKGVGLHSFREENGVKIYSFENEQWDYAVRLEPFSDQQTRITTKRVLITTLPY